MGTVELNLPVRNGKGCCFHVIATRFIYYYFFRSFIPSKLHSKYSFLFGQALDLLVSVSLTCHHAYTPDLSPPVLGGVLLAFAMGNLVLGWASHLDAFSVYPFPT